MGVTLLISKEGTRPSDVKGLRLEQSQEVSRAARLHGTGCPDYSQVSGDSRTGTSDT